MTIDSRAREEGTLLDPRFDEKGLITAVVTDFSSKALLMVAHMNREALDLSLTTGVAHYFSRSRGTLWKKGETSGALQTIRDMRIDCDQDAVWLAVDVAVPQDTCHTRRTTCFYRRIELEGPQGRLTSIEEGTGNGDRPHNAK